MTATVILIALGIVLTALFMLRKVRKEVLVRRNTEAMLNSLLENLPAAVCLFDSSCRCRKLNAMCASIFGFTEQTALDASRNGFPRGFRRAFRKSVEGRPGVRRTPYVPPLPHRCGWKTAYYQTTLVPCARRMKKRMPSSA